MAILGARRSGESVPERAWHALFTSEGYRNLAIRERGMHRDFSDSAFRSFVLSDSLLIRYEALASALVSYRQMDIAGDARRALSYLPDGASIHARLYIEIKPRTNSFVFPVPEGRAIFLYLDPTVDRARAERDIVTHELHHIGFSESCAELHAPSPPRETARQYSGALGEGFAMLATAGSPDVDPHELSTPPTRERWYRDLSRWKEDFPKVQSFLLDVAEGRLSNADSMAAIAAPFWGDAQGAWYTVGYMLATTIERAQGRDVLRRNICERASLMSTYNQIARDRALPIWNERLIQLLRPD